MHRLVHKYSNTCIYIQCEYQKLDLKTTILLSRCNARAILLVYTYIPKTFYPFTVVNFIFVSKVVLNFCVHLLEKEKKVYQFFCMCGARCGPAKPAHLFSCPRSWENHVCARGGKYSEFCTGRPRQSRPVFLFVSSVSFFVLFSFSFFFFHFFPFKFIFTFYSFLHPNFLRNVQNSIFLFLKCSKFQYFFTILINAQNFKFVLI